MVEIGSMDMGESVVVVGDRGWCVQMGCLEMVDREEGIQPPGGVEGGSIRNRGYGRQAGHTHPT